MSSLMILFLSLFLWGLPVVIALVRKHNFIATAFVVVLFIGMNLLLRRFLADHLLIGMMVGGWIYAMMLTFIKKELDADFVRLFDKLRGKKPDAPQQASSHATDEKP